jgi:hypothetical protein
MHDCIKLRLSRFLLGWFGDAIAVWVGVGLRVRYAFGIKLRLSRYDKIG